MVVFGLILLVLALAVIAYMWFATSGMTAVDIDYGFLNMAVEPFWLFVAGGITLAAATCGLWMMAVGTRSKARKAKEVRELRRQAKEADRRAVRADDASSLDRRGDASRTDRHGRDDHRARDDHRDASRPGTAAPGASRTDQDRADAPILPRPHRNDGPGTPGQR